MAAQSGNDKAIRCLLDVLGGQRSKDDPSELIDRIPPARFGRGKARILRKMVLLAIAANAKPDGTESYPSLGTIARRCLVSERAVRNTIQWLVDHGLLRVEMYAGPQHTNRYTVLFNPEIELPSSGAHGASRSAEQDGTKAPDYPAIELPGEPGRMEPQPGNRTSDKRPLERPLLDRKETHDAEPRENRSNSAMCSPSRNRMDENERTTRDPSDALLTAARVLAKEYGTDGINLAAYICAHAINGKAEPPRTVSYYTISARDGFLRDGDEDFPRTGDTHHLIHPEMIEDGLDRLRRAVEHTDADLYDAIDQLQEMHDTLTAREAEVWKKMDDAATPKTPAAAAPPVPFCQPKPIPCGECGVTFSSAVTLSGHLPCPFEKWTARAAA